MPAAVPRRAFSLIEAALVLAIVGLVIGAIWVAANDITSRQRLNETAAGALATIHNARNIFPLQAYPVTYGVGINAGSTLNAAKAYPLDWQGGGNHAISPAGVRIEVVLSCWGTYPSDLCPMLGFRFWGPGQTTYPTKLTIAECSYLVRRMINVTRSMSDFLYLQFRSPTNALYYKPIDPDQIQCSSSTSDILFWFKP